MVAEYHPARMFTVSPSTWRMQPVLRRAAPVNAALVQALQGRFGAPQALVQVEAAQCRGSTDMAAICRPDVADGAQSPC
jgi:hypothetical protein